jgi:pyruvate kinase
MKGELGDFRRELHETSSQQDQDCLYHRVKILEQMIRAGMNVARLNFSHGDFDSHKKVIDNIRAAAGAVGERVAIMADLPGPKMRIGQLAEEPIDLVPEDPFTLTTEEIVGDSKRVSMSFPRLPHVVKKGDILFLNDGLIQLEVAMVEGNDVHCQVLVGGELRSRKGLNIPDIDLGISAFTDRRTGPQSFYYRQAGTHAGERTVRRYF